MTASSPKLNFHGGQCCGLKTIQGLGNKPDTKAPALVKETRAGVEARPDQWGRDVSSETNMFHGEAPVETYLERLDRYLKYLKRAQPHGIIEVVLCDYSKHKSQAYLYDQVAPWEPLLLERGFVLVNSCYNSNSGNRVYVYHLKTDKEVPVEKKDVCVSPVSAPPSLDELFDDGDGLDGAADE